MRYVQFSDESESTIISVFSSPQNPAFWANYAEIDDDDPRYLAYINPPSPTDVLASAARAQRDVLLRGIYDPGILMALRVLRMASSPEETAYAEGKISELDAYAVALTAVPDQAGFPQTIIWPVAPTK